MRILKESSVTSYPAAGKRQIKPKMRIVTLADVPYYDEEE